MSTVNFQRAEYDYGALMPTVSRMLDRIDRLRIEPGMRVLIKPNFLTPARPEWALTTHPLLASSTLTLSSANALKSGSCWNPIPDAKMQRAKLEKEVQTSRTLLDESTKG